MINLSIICAGNVRYTSLQNVIAAADKGVLMFSKPISPPIGLVYEGILGMQRRLIKPIVFTAHLCQGLLTTAQQ